MGCNNPSSYYSYAALAIGLWRRLGESSVLDGRERVLRDELQGKTLPFTAMGGLSAAQVSSSTHESSQACGYRNASGVKRKRRLIAP